MNDRAWLMCTKMTGSEAYLLARQITDQLKYFGHDIELSDMKRLGTESEELMGDGSLHYKIGVKELIENPRKRLSMAEALAPVVGACHEVFGHGGQWRNEANKDMPLSRLLILNDLACKSSFSYYGVDFDYEEPTPQYFKQPHEIAAQYIGLKAANKFLSSVYGKSKADDLLCEYVNLRIASGNEYIQAPDDYHMEESSDGRKPYMKPTEPFTSMSQVYDQFQKTFIDQASARAEYNVPKFPIDYPSIHIDTLKRPWEKISSQMMINHMPDRMTQIYVLSCIWLNQHEYGKWMKELPVFEHIEFPKTVLQMMRNVPARPIEVDLDLRMLTEDSLTFNLSPEQSILTITHNHDIIEIENTTRW